MVARTLDGKNEAKKILRQLRQELIRHNRPITLASILVGRRFDSIMYIRLKTAAAHQVGIRTEHFHLPTSATSAQLNALIRTLNRRRDIHGILLQLPLPKHFNADRLVKLISPNKDVDGFHPQSKVIPPTVAAVLHLLKLAKPPARAAAVVFGRNSVFTKKLFSELRRRGFTTPPAGLPRALSRGGGAGGGGSKSADIIITALGRGPRLTAAKIKPNAIIIDVGIRTLQGKTVGDVAPSVWMKAKAVSPVPGGVGPLTVAYLLYNAYYLSLKR